MATAIWWMRRDLRLDDNPALAAALESGRLVPLYVHAPDEEAPWVPGAASQAWLRRSLQAIEADLRARGSGLILRRGPALAALLAVAKETGAEAVHWNRLYEPASLGRDAKVKQALRELGLRAESHNAALMVEPWHIATDAGAPYRVFTPFWRRARTRLDSLPASLPTPQILSPLPSLPTEPLEAVLPAPSPSWDRGFWKVWQPGEAGALGLLEAFIDGAAHGYREQRDRPDRIGTSRLSPHLHFGEISPRRLLQRLRAEPWPAALAADIESFEKELGWREFSHHLMFHFPHGTERDLTPGFRDFAWAEPDERVLHAWQHGCSGIPIIDAGMRELWQTGWMHNRVRMIVASFLCKNLRQHWRHGARWFWDTLVDADLANNSQGWQWSAGTGVDAAPYFRIFNPVMQARRFDPQGRYLRRWLPELVGLPDVALFEPWTHPELRQRLAPDYRSQPLVDLKLSREAALHAYRSMRGT